MRKWSPLFVVLALPIAFFATATVIGIGILRQGSPAWIAGVGILAVVLPPMALIVSRILKWFLFSVGLIGWSMTIMYVFPVFFPGERGMAMHVGCAMLNVNPEWAKIANEIFPRLPDGLSPATMATPAVDNFKSNIFRDLAQDAVVLPVESHGSTISLPLTIKDTEIWLLFDTGASLTTLNEETLIELGVDIPDDAPVVQLRTANGIRESRLVMLSDVWLGGLYVGHVTVAVCEPCADEQTKGLLGLNVSSRFLVTVDSEREELILQPGQEVPNMTSEIKPWVDIDATVRQWLDGRTELDIAVTNTSDVDIGMAELVVICGAKYTTYVGEILARDIVETRLALPLVEPNQEERNCSQFQVGLNYARWTDTEG
ncbi:MAG: retropepsin-like aspartic protease [Myxococcota bacterium]|nr:retropepsin-like aspartic protease [Myxococcota bacterium]